MAEYGEWNKKGATLSDVTAKKEYGVERDLIIRGIREGKLEFREGDIYGNPYLRILRRQLEEYLALQPDSGQYFTNKKMAEIRRINKDIAALEKKIRNLKKERAELEDQLNRHA
ncbi:MAG: hypothetical protein JXA44_11100 [Methanospirillaceae archaeon]|nr:hypothetical protein [Methanospirillaceae archaeon]